MKKYEWWSSLDYSKKAHYRISFTPSFSFTEEIQRFYEKDYLNKFTAGQQVWIDGKEYLYMFPFTFKKSTGKHYVIKGSNGDCMDGKVRLVVTSEISTTRPEPPIKKGTPVLCWNNTNPSCVVIAFYICKTDKKHVVNYLRGADDCDNFFFDNVEVYKQ